MTEIVLDIMNKFGVFGIFLLILIENIFPPIPSEVILTFGGFLTTLENSNLSILAVVILATLGSYIGALILYKVGTIFNVHSINVWLNDSRVKKLGFKKDDLRRTLKFFNNWRSFAVLFGRCVPFIRSLISIPAGMTKMNIYKFSIYTIIGSAIWNTTLITLGAVFGNNREIVLEYLRKYSFFVSIIIGVLLIYFLIRIIKIRKELNSSQK